jgi:hemolysin III
MSKEANDIISKREAADDSPLPLTRANCSSSTSLDANAAKTLKPSKGSAVLAPEIAVDDSSRNVCHGSVGIKRRKKPTTSSSEVGNNDKHDGGGSTKKLKRQSSSTISRKPFSHEKERLSKKIMSRASSTTIRTRASHRFSATERIHSEVMGAVEPPASAKGSNDGGEQATIIDDEKGSIGTESAIKEVVIVSRTSESLLPSAMRILSPFFLCNQTSCCASCDAGDYDVTSSVPKTVGLPSSAGEYVQRSPSAVATSRKNANISELSPAEKAIQPKQGISSSMSVVEILFQSYYAACTLYNCKPNPGVLTALRFGLPALRVSGAFFDSEMLALAEILLEFSNTHLSHVKRLDFTRASKEGKAHGQKGFQSHGAYALSRVLLQSKHITEVFVQRHKIGPYGAAAIFRSCEYNPTVKVLALRRCMIGEPGALAFASCIMSPSCGLLEVDLSNCRMGYSGTKRICDALVEREHSGLTPTEVDLEGNMIFQEVMNAATHGLGIIFAIVGSIMLSNKAKGRPLHYSVACGVYSASILFLYTCSTLYHSFFALKTTRYIFGIFDHCAIYLLIAGSYTAFIGICLTDDTAWSLYLLAFIWVCSLLGVYVEAFYLTWQHKGTFSLCMYLGLGWACMVCLPNLIEAMPRKSLIMLVMGGVGYTGGVPFFVRNNNLDHSIWHMFVLAASICHWIGVYTLISVEEDE